MHFAEKIELAGRTQTRVQSSWNTRYEIANFEEVAPCERAISLRRSQKPGRTASGASATLFRQTWEGDDLDFSRVVSHVALTENAPTIL